MFREIGFDKSTFCKYNTNDFNFLIDDVPSDVTATPKHHVVIAFELCGLTLLLNKIYAKCVRTATGIFQ